MSLFGIASCVSVFIEIVFFLSTFVRKMIITVFFYNILYKYKNTFNNNKLLKMIFIKKYIYYNNNPKTFIKKYKHLYY